MTVFITFLPVILTVLSATLSQVNALGCYSKGLDFDGLHGEPMDNYQEVVNDINITCNMVTNKRFVGGEQPGFTRCSQWAISEAAYNECLAECRRKGELIAECDMGCKGGKDGSKNNKINWQINLPAGHHLHQLELPRSELMTWETCSHAFVKELNGCSRGSEQIHDGFWFKIDPNEGDC